MKLDYKIQLKLEQSPFVLLQKGGARVELHLRQDDSGRCTLLAFAGVSEAPDKSLEQGPYDNLQQALAACKAIVVQLQGKGYDYVDALPIWRLQAQKAILSARAKRATTAVDTQFKPGDVFLDW